MSHTIRTTMRPDVEITVPDAEYENLLELGLVYDGTPPDPVADPFDARAADVVGDVDSLTRDALDAWLAVSGGGGGGGTVADATASTKGIVQLAGDLGGTAAAPTVPGLATKVNSSTYTAGLAAKQDVATLGADVAADPTVKAALGTPALSDVVAVAPLPGTLYNIKAQNADSYSQDNVTTHNGVQYAVWVNAARDPVIGKRILPSNTWTTFDLSTVAGNPLNSPTVDDLHNNYVVAVDNDGFLHVSGNQHDSPLRYVRSATPGDITAWTTPAMVGAQEDLVTYPQFIRRGTELLFLYRNGASGNGNTYLNAYDTTTKAWTRRAQIFQGMAPVSPDESAYTNHVALGADGALHLFYTWRQTADVATSHDLGHIQSTDGGITWTDAAGTAQTLPLTPSTAPKFVTGAWPALQALNQSGAAVDDQGRPHAVWWVGQDPDQFAKLHHYWWNGSAWVDEVLINHGRYVPPLTLGRPAAFAYGSRVFAVYSPDADLNRTALVCQDITPSPATRLPTFRLLGADIGAYEPTFDTRAVAERGELHMLVTPISPVDPATDPQFQQAWGAVLSVDLTRVEAVAGLRRTISSKPEKLWLPATAMIGGAGSPTLNVANGFPGWLLDANTLEAVFGSAYLPENWQRFHVDMWWANAGAGAGNVVMNFRYTFRDVGTDMTGGEVNLGNVTLTAAAQNISTVTRVGTGIVRVPSQPMRYNIRRQAADANDTVANDVVVYGFLLTRADL